MQGGGILISALKGPGTVLALSLLMVVGFTLLNVGLRDIGRVFITPWPIACANHPRQVPPNPLAQGVAPALARRSQKPKQTQGYAHANPANHLGGRGHQTHRRGERRFIPGRQ